MDLLTLSQREGHLLLDHGCPWVTEMTESLTTYKGGETTVLLGDIVPSVAFLKIPDTSYALLCENCHSLSLLPLPCHLCFK